MLRLIKLLFAALLVLGSTPAFADVPPDDGGGDDDDDACECGIVGGAQPNDDLALSLLIGGVASALGRRRR